MPAQIEDLVTERLERRNGSACNIIQICEAAGLFTVSIKLHRTPFNDPFSETKHTHIRASCWAIDGKISHYTYIKVIEGVIRVAQNFSCFLTGCVRLERVFAVCGFRRGEWRVGSVNAGSGSLYKLPNFF